MTQPMRFIATLTVLVMVIPALIGCRPVPYPDLSTSTETRSVYLVSHGLHVGLALDREDVDDEALPVVQWLPEVDFVEFGWGDIDYYPHPSPSLIDGARALFWPTDSVLHVVGLRGELSAIFPRSTIIRVDVPAEGMRYLIDFIASYQIADAEPLTQSLYGTGHFFPAEGSYHLLNNSNRWTAEALERAGVPIASSIIVTASQVVEQGKRVGELVSRPE